MTQDAAADAKADKVADADDAGPVSIDAGDGMQPGVLACGQLDSKEPMPARDVVAAGNVEPQMQAVFTSDVFSLFKSACGACHVESVRAGFQVKSLAVFAEATRERQQLILDKIRSDDPTTYMPPAGQTNAKKWSERSQDDPVVELASRLEAWFAAGSPPDLFHVQADNADANADPTRGRYLLSKDTAAALTNIGNCLPAKNIVAKDSAAMSELDKFFENAKELPQRLDQTDLTSLDSETLAKTGVISYAPTYPLFSDNARKMRHLRIPRGQSLVFDKARQEFTVPPNTRVYKTFSKRVVDANGNERFRKIETRLIVARPDGPDAEDGSHETTALFGSYAWNDDETEATLVTDPQRNGKPFRDRLLTYITDEGKAAEVLAGNPFNKVIALQEAGATRHYAIPGSDRCVQCHMGSPNRSFLLGVTPLQLLRRATGTGGTYEETSDDELNQLQRLIDYKVITGISSPDDVLPLEKSQGDRAPRNEHELTAQGYLLGNCAHCHNPRGFPTVQNAVLKDLLHFFPKKDGGIFQFPLDRTSPRIKRGVRQDILLPYISPSLFDLEQESVDGQTSPYTPKYLGTAADGISGYYMAAPWRSLIYRNVDSPFSYSEDYALYPHMPMNATGFDCRAPRILGNWMVSIPARPPQPEPSLADPNKGNETRDPSPALFTEVRPDEKDYALAVSQAKERLDAYQKGGRVNFDILDKKWTYTYLSGYRYSDYCADTSDIVDPNVVPGNVDALTPHDLSFLPSLAKDLAGDETTPRGRFAVGLDGVPDRAHWVVTDITDAPGDWYPRRSDWPAVLVDKKLDGIDPAQQQVIEILQNVKVSEAFRKFAVTPVPFGIWPKKDGCDFSGVPTVGSLSQAERPAWLDNKIPSPAANDPLYFESPGQSVFNGICINCHGPKYDSRGRQADTLILMTGGDTRVANLRDGLLGPVTDPGANRTRVFKQHESATVTADDWAARYVAWMGLGGTQRAIPSAILGLVGASQVLGEVRPSPVRAESANMLSVAQTLCAQSIGRDRSGSGVTFDVDTGSEVLAATTMALIGDNGDAELWKNLCAFDNAPPVRVLSAFPSDFRLLVTTDITAGTSPWYKSSSYPSNALIGDHHGRATTGIQPGNIGPWCVLAPTDPAIQARLAQLQAARKPEQGEIPLCPEAWLTEENKVKEADFQAWALRASMNAGIAVFLYLDKLSRDALAGKAPPLRYDQCELLPH